MAWHRSISNPRKVYNQRHEQMCVCETPEQARAVVDAVNAIAANPNAPASPGGRADQSKRGRDAAEIDPDAGSFAIV